MVTSACTPDLTFPFSGSRRLVEFAQEGIHEDLEFNAALRIHVSAASKLCNDSLLTTFYGFDGSTVNKSCNSPAVEAADCTNWPNYAQRSRLRQL
jgi:hypothetical protein